MTVGERLSIPYLNQYGEHFLHISCKLIFTPKIRRNSLRIEAYPKSLVYFRHWLEQIREFAKQNKTVCGKRGRNQNRCHMLVGGSNIVVNAIDTASFGMPGTIAEWIMGPNPEGDVDPLDDPYGKKAGQIAGSFVSIGLPWKYVKAIKTGGAVAEGFDAFNDFREDGKQSLGERLTAVAINTAVAGAGDVAITAGSKLAASAVRLVRGKLPDIKVEKVEVAGKASDEVEIKEKEINESRIEGTGEGRRLNPTFTNDFESHFSQVDKYTQAKGISGGHNLDEFVKVVKDKNLLIVQEIPHPTIPGIKEVKYQVPKVDPAGNPIGGHKPKVLDKTVYDPSVVSDAQMAQWAKEAATDALNVKRIDSVTRKWEGISLNGIKFEGFINGTGEFETAYPTINP